MICAFIRSLYEKNIDHIRANIVASVAKNDRHLSEEAREEYVTNAMDEIWIESPTEIFSTYKRFSYAVFIDVLTGKIQDDRGGALTQKMLNISFAGDERRRTNVECWQKNLASNSFRHWEGLPSVDGVDREQVMKEMWAAVTAIGDTEGAHAARRPELDLTRLENKAERPGLQDHTAPVVAGLYQLINYNYVRPIEYTRVDNAGKPVYPRLKGEEAAYAWAVAKTALYPSSHHDSVPESDDDRQRVAGLLMVNGCFLGSLIHAHDPFQYNVVELDDMHAIPDRVKHAVDFAEEKYGLPNLFHVPSARRGPRPAHTVLYRDEWFVLLEITLMYRFFCRKAPMDIKTFTIGLRLKRILECDRHRADFNSGIQALQHWVADTGQQLDPSQPPGDWEAAFIGHKAAAREMASRWVKVTEDFAITHIMSAELNGEAPTGLVAGPADILGVWDKISLLEATLESAFVADSGRAGAVAKISDLVTNIAGAMAEPPDADLAGFAGVTDAVLRASLTAQWAEAGGGGRAQIFPQVDACFEDITGLYRMLLGRLKDAAEGRSVCDLLLGASSAVAPSETVEDVTECHRLCDGFVGDLSRAWDDLTSRSAATITVHTALIEYAALGDRLTRTLDVLWEPLRQFTRFTPELKEGVLTALSAYLDDDIKPAMSRMTAISGDLVNLGLHPSDVIREFAGEDDTISIDTLNDSVGGFRAELEAQRALYDIEARNKVSADLLALFDEEGVKIGGELLSMIRRYLSWDVDTIMDLNDPRVEEFSDQAALWTDEEHPDCLANRYVEALEGVQKVEEYLLSRGEVTRIKTGQLHAQLSTLNIIAQQRVDMLTDRVGKLEMAAETTEELREAMAQMEATLDIQNEGLPGIEAMASPADAKTHSATEAHQTLSAARATLANVSSIGWMDRVAALCMKAPSPASDSDVTFIDEIRAGGEALITAYGETCRAVAHRTALLHAVHPAARLVRLTVNATIAYLENWRVRMTGLVADQNAGNDAADDAVDSTLATLFGAIQYGQDTLTFVDTTTDMLAAPAQPVPVPVAVLCPGRHDLEVVVDDLTALRREAIEGLGRRLIAVHETSADELHIEGVEALIRELDAAVGVDEAALGRPVPEIVGCRMAARKGAMTMDDDDDVAPALTALMTRDEAVALHGAGTLMGGLYTLWAIAEDAREAAAGHAATLTRLTEFGGRHGGTIAGGAGDCLRSIARRIADIRQAADTRAGRTAAAMELYQGYSKAETQLLAASTALARAVDEAVLSTRDRATLEELTEHHTTLRRLLDALPTDGGVLPLPSTIQAQATACTMRLGSLREMFAEEDRLMAAEEALQDDIQAVGASTVAERVLGAMMRHYRGLTDTADPSHALQHATVLLLDSVWPVDRDAMTSIAQALDGATDIHAISVDTANQHSDAVTATALAVADLDRSCRADLAHATFTVQQTLELALADARLTAVARFLEHSPALHAESLMDTAGRPMPEAFTVASARQEALEGITREILAPVAGLVADLDRQRVEHSFAPTRDLLQAVTDHRSLRDAVTSMIEGLEADLGRLVTATGGQRATGQSYGLVSSVALDDVITVLGDLVKPCEIACAADADAALDRTGDGLARVAGVDWPRLAELSSSLDGPPEIPHTLLDNLRVQVVGCGRALTEELLTAKAFYNVQTSQTGLMGPVLARLGAHVADGERALAGIAGQLRGGPDEIRKGLHALLALRTTHAEAGRCVDDGLAAVLNVLELLPDLHRTLPSSADTVKIGGVLSFRPTPNQDHLLELTSLEARYDGLGDRLADLYVDAIDALMQVGTADDYETKVLSTAANLMAMMEGGRPTADFALDAMGGLMQDLQDGIGGINGRHRATVERVLAQADSFRANAGRSRSGGPGEELRDLRDAVRSFSSASQAVRQTLRAALDHMLTAARTVVGDDGAEGLAVQLDQWSATLPEIEESLAGLGAAADLLDGEGDSDFGEVGRLEARLAATCRGYRVLEALLDPDRDAQLLMERETGCIAADEEMQAVHEALAVRTASDDPADVRQFITSTVEAAMPHVARFMDAEEAVYRAGHVIGGVTEAHPAARVLSFTRAHLARCKTMIEGAAIDSAVEVDRTVTLCRQEAWEAAVACLEDAAHATDAPDAQFLFMSRHPIIVAHVPRLRAAAAHLGPDATLRLRQLERDVDTISATHQTGLAAWTGRVDVYRGAMDAVVEGLGYCVRTPLTGRAGGRGRGLAEYRRLQDEAEACSDECGRLLTLQDDAAAVLDALTGDDPHGLLSDVGTAQASLTEALATRRAAARRVSSGAGDVLTEATRDVDTRADIEHTLEELNSRAGGAGIIIDGPGLMAAGSRAISDAARLIARRSAPHDEDFGAEVDAMAGRVLATVTLVENRLADTRSKDQQVARQTIAEAYTGHFSSALTSGVAVATPLMERVEAFLTTHPPTESIDEDAVEELKTAQGEVLALEAALAPHLRRVGRRLGLVTPPPDTPPAPPGLGDVMKMGRVAVDVKGILGRISRLRDGHRQLMAAVQLDLIVPGIAVDPVERATAQMTLADHWLTIAKAELDRAVPPSPEIAVFGLPTIPMIVEARLEALDTIIDGLGVGTIDYPSSSKKGATRSSMLLLNDINALLTTTRGAPRPDPALASRVIEEGQISGEVARLITRQLVAWTDIRIAGPEDVPVAEGHVDAVAAHLMQAHQYIDECANPTLGSPRDVANAVYGADLSGSGLLRMASLVDGCQAEGRGRVADIMSRQAQQEGDMDRYEDVAAAVKAELDDVQQQMADLSDKTTHVLARRAALSIDVGNDIEDDSLHDTLQQARDAPVQSGADLTAPLLPAAMEVGASDEESEAEDAGAELHSINQAIEGLRGDVDRLTEDALAMQDRFGQLFEFCLEFPSSAVIGQLLTRYGVWCDVINRLGLLSSTMGHSVSITHLPEGYTPFGVNIAELTQFIQQSDEFITQFVLTFGTPADPTRPLLPGESVVSHYRPATDGGVSFPTLFDGLTALPLLVQFFREMEVMGNLHAALKVGLEEGALANHMSAARLAPLRERSERMDRDWERLVVDAGRMLPSVDRATSMLEDKINAARSHLDLDAELSAAELALGMWSALQDEDAPRHPAPATETHSWPAVSNRSDRETVRVAILDSFPDATVTVGSLGAFTADPASCRARLALQEGQMVEVAFVEDIIAAIERRLRSGPRSLVGAVQHLLNTGVSGPLTIEGDDDVEEELLRAPEAALDAVQAAHEAAEEAMAAARATAEAGRAKAAGLVKGAQTIRQNAVATYARLVLAAQYLLNMSAEAATDAQIGVMSELMNGAVDAVIRTTGGQFSVSPTDDVVRSALQSVPLIDQLAMGPVGLEFLREGIHSIGAGDLDRVRGLAAAVVKSIEARREVLRDTMDRYQVTGEQFVVHKAIFALFDTDHNDTLEWDEVEQMLTIFGVPETAFDSVHAKFIQCDADGNGEMDMEEYFNFVRQVSILQPPDLAQFSDIIGNLSGSVRELFGMVLNDDEMKQLHGKFPQRTDRSGEMAQVRSMFVGARPRRRGQKHAPPPRDLGLSAVTVESAK